MIFRLFLCLQLAFALTSCSKFGAASSAIDPAFFRQGEGGLNPSTDKLSENCFSDDSFDACIFQKNPVAQEKLALNFAEVSSKRRFGVKIRGLALTGYLENSRIQVYALNSPRFTLAQRGLLKSPLASPSVVAQFNAYYWANRTFDYLSAQLGAEYIFTTGLKIYVDDAFTGYSSSYRSVHLSLKEEKIPHAFSGEVVAYMVAQGIVDDLSQRRIFVKDSVQHKFCQQDPKGCCQSQNGCAQALANAFGEYTVGLMFPTTPIVGETLLNSLEGQKICGLSRNLNTLASQTSSQVYLACEVPGRTPLMGAWYASLWWKLHTQIGADADHLFFEHAKTWTASTTFVDAKSSAIELATTFKNGQYLNLVKSALNAISN